MSSIPDDLTCPITQLLFVDPVMAEDGFTYSKSAIIEWLKKNPTSPMTREPIDKNKLAPNYNIAKRCKQYYIGAPKESSSDTIINIIPPVQIPIQIPTNNNQQLKQCYRSCCDCTVFVILCMLGMSLSYIVIGLILGALAGIDAVIGYLAISINGSKCCACWNYCWIPCWLKPAEAFLQGFTYMFTGHGVCCKCCVSCCGWDGVCFIPGLASQAVCDCALSSGPDCCAAACGKNCCHVCCCCCCNSCY